MDPFLDASTGPCRIVSRRALLASGLSSERITAAVRSRALLRVRRDHYALPGTNRHTLEAVRVGGREACISGARQIGFFAFDTRFTHVHLDRGASRLRSPRNRRVPLAVVPRDGVELHWWPLIDPVDASDHCVGARDALAQIIQCQEPRFALAALDTALHERKIWPSDLSEIQVSIAGVGRVDLVVEGCVVVEADSFAHHKSWEEHTRDRTRDRLLAARRYLTLRVLYHDIMFDPEGVLAAIRELVSICSNGSDRVRTFA
jgi:very-short-patch-repair endonuclease